MSRPERPPQIALSAKARRTGEPPISVLMAAALADPNLINFAAGFVNPLTLPVEPVRQIAETIFSNPQRGRAALQYDTTRGLASLREAAVHHLEKLERKTAHELHISPRHILITTGSQQALYLIGDCLIDPGDIVIAANPCYFVFTGTLASLGANVLAVPMTEDGIDVAAVEQLLARLESEGRLDRVKMIYTTSYYQNPTGLTLSLESRKKLLEIARRFSERNRILILEDAAYRELRYDGPDLPSIKSLEGANVQTILTQTFSKPFAPGLKTGYTVLPPELLEAVVHQKGNHDFGSASLTQHIAAEAMTGGLYYDHVKQLCESYRHKRDALLDSLERYCPREIAFGSGNAKNPHPSCGNQQHYRARGEERRCESPDNSAKSQGISWTRPAGGLYVWVTLPPHCDASRDAALFAESTRRGVLYVPGDYSFQPDETGHVPKNHLRLSFGQVDPQQIEPGIKRFCEALAATMSPQSSSAARGGGEKREAIFRA